MTEHNNNRDAGEVKGTVKYIDENGEIVKQESEHIVRKNAYVAVVIDECKLTIPWRRVMLVEEDYE